MKTAKFNSCKQLIVQNLHFIKARTTSLLHNFATLNCK